MKKIVNYHLNLSNASAEDKELILTENSAHILSESTLDQNPSYFFTRLVDVIFNAFFITPLSILFWTSTLDIFEEYFTGTLFYWRILAIFFICNLTLCTIYLLQKRLQTFHDRLKQISTSSRYCGKDYLFRCLFTYLLTLAYNLQWITYWDLYDHLASGVHYAYTFTLAILAMAIYKFLLQRPFSTLTKIVPFELQVDTDFDTYFIQNNSIKLDDEDQKVFLFSPILTF